MRASSHLTWIRTMSAGKKGLQLSLMIHALVYAFVLAGLWYIGQTATADRPGWVGIVAWGWGMGLAAHAAVWLMFGRGQARGARR
jgi:hypothetical protein